MMTTRPFQVPLGERQLFLDDHGVAAIQKLERVLHPPEKKGAVIELDYPHETSLLIGGAPTWDPIAHCFRVWVTVDGGTALFESEDGLDWARPRLRRTEHRGSLENNLVAGPCGYHVIFDPHDPDASRRYKSIHLRGAMERVVSPISQHWKLDHNPWRLAYDRGHVLNDPRQYQLSWVIQVEERENAPADERFEGRGCFQTHDLTVSHDGIHWRALDRPGLPTGDTGHLSFDEVTGTYIATVKEGEMGPHGRSIALATSKDFDHWSQPELVFHSDDEDQELARERIAERLANPQMVQPIYNVPEEYFVDIYNMGVFRYGGLYIGMAAFFHHTGDVNENSDGFHVVQLASSRDLYNWNRVAERAAFIAPSAVDTGDYDLSQIMSPSGPVQMNGELWFYYYGGKYRSPHEDDDPRRTAVCRAVLRRDGFVSLDAGGKEGSVLTDSFLLQSPWLFANLDATAGSVRVEVLDESGSSIAASEPIKGNHLRYPVQWQSGDLAAAVNRPVQLRFTASAASIYSYWFDEVTEPAPH
jgi:hypothetical protein